MQNKKQKPKTTITRITKNISYLEFPTYAGFYGRLRWRNKEYQQFFSVLKYNGYDNALEQAINWRDSLELKIGKPRTSKPIRAFVKRTNTGLKHISIYDRKYYDRNGYTGKKYTIFSVHISRNDYEVQRSFSIEKYGYYEARAMAIKCRDRLLQEAPADVNAFNLSQA